MNRCISRLMAGLMILWTTAGCEIFSQQAEDFNIAVLNDADENISFQGKESSRSIFIFSTGPWTAASDQSWCSVSPQSGQDGRTEVLISVAGNDSPDERTSQIVFKSGEDTAIVSVTQYGVSIKTLTVTHDGESFRMPLFEGAYDGTVDWGDGQTAAFEDAELHN